MQNIKWMKQLTSFYWLQINSCLNLKIERNKGTGYSIYNYQKELDQGCFQRLFSPRKAASDKVLRHKAFNIPKNPKCDGYERGLASIAYKCFDKTTFSSNTSGGAVKSEIMQNQVLAIGLTQSNY